MCMCVQKVVLVSLCCDCNGSLYFGLTVTNHASIMIIISCHVCLCVQKVLYKHVMPTLLEESKQSDSVVYALPTLLTVIDFATRDDYVDNILKEFCAILTLPKPVQVSVSTLFLIHNCTPHIHSRSLRWRGQTSR
jgi:hypothetical protein